MMDTHETHYVNTYVNNPTPCKWMDEKLDLQKNGRNVILFDVYFENCFISTYWL